MDTTLKNILFLIVGAVIGIGIGYVAFHGKYQLAGAIGPTGIVQTSGVQNVSVSIAPANNTSTSTSVLNNGYDRAITTVNVYCTQASTTLAGLVTLNLSVSTSSTATYSTPVNYIVNALAIATTTTNSYAATTTFPSAASQDWVGGSYLQFNFNATTTAVCTASAQSIQL